RNWVKQVPEFREAIGAAQEYLRSEARGEFKAMTAAAVRELWKLLRSKNEAVRLKAVLGAIDREMKVSEVVELQAEVAAIKARLERGGGHVAERPARRSAEGGEDVG